jgi:leucine dehydrogenase
LTATSGVIEEMQHRGHEGVWFASDRGTGLRAIVAVHSTALGPALGGTRIRPYPSETEALIDVLRLSRAMTYKAAAAGLPLGGGKAVIIADPAVDKTPELLTAYGRAVDRLGGTYLTAEDVGSTVSDMEIVAGATEHVTGLPESMGGSGDPSPATAHGVLAAMRAAAEFSWGTSDLAGRSVAIQGVGKVGSFLARLLAAEGCEVVVADVMDSAVAAVVDETGATAVGVDDILSEHCDFLSPCALGAVLNESTIPTLHCRAVVGSANNQLLDTADASRLAAEGVLYVPDFVANAGGIININEEFHPDGYSLDRALVSVRRIHDTTLEVLHEAAASGGGTLEAAETLAERRLRATAAV